MSNGPIFILGAPRSGTTLLQYLFKSHPKVSIPGEESHFIIPFYKKFKNIELSKKKIVSILMEMKKMRPQFFCEQVNPALVINDTLIDNMGLENVHDFPSLVQRLYQYNAESEGKVIWGDKTPYYILHIKLLLEMFPDARFIHVLRDGRDVALSVLDRKHDFFIYNLYMAAKTWEFYVKTGREQGVKLRNDQYCEVKYEELVSRPGEVMKSLCDFIQIEYTAKVLDFDRPKSLTTNLLKKTPMIQQAISKSNTAKWKRNLTSDKIELFDSSVGALLAELGYPVAPCVSELPLVKRGYYRVNNYILSFFYRSALGVS